ncbi:MAG: PBP1A family penicillin-binding protein [Alphaproteobacteria bacterium]|nr:PBP1A family penicillin-binding protein [Alphaproteobacteria bacterium]
MPPLNVILDRLNIAFKWAFRIMFYAIVAGVFAFTFIIVRYAFTDLPDYKALATYTPPVATRLFASDGSLLQEYAEERRVFIDFEDIPPMLVNAFIAAEDQNFWWHPGIDPIGIVRALKNNTIRWLGGPARFSGASTITQQVAKNFFLTPERSIERKVKEAVLALRLERAFSKQHIMTLYLNQIFLGGRAHGIGSAALVYFDKPVQELTLNQMAFLAALPMAPNNRVRAIHRRNYVLGRMVADGFISQEAADEALSMDREVRGLVRAGEITQAEANERLTAHLNFTRGFWDRMEPEFQFFAEEVRRELLAELGRERLYNHGLYVRTTIDPRLQRAAANALRAELRRYNNAHHRNAEGTQLQGGIIVINPHTGRVLAMTGGYCFRESSFNRAMQARRQVGSALKPFIYLAALETGNFTPQTLLLDTPIVGFREGDLLWKPENFDRRFLGPVPFRFALETSRNVPVIRLVEDIGLRPSIEAATRFGVYETRRIRDWNMSLALGSGETTLARLTKGFAAFVNGGHLIDLAFVDYVQDRFGRNINVEVRGKRYETRGMEDWVPGMLPPPPIERGEPLADPRLLYQITSILQGAVEHGTGRQARVPGQTVAGKTGTTNEVRDVWFIGYSKDLAVGVWMGYDTPRPMARGSGSFMAARVFGNFMREALYGQPNRPFPIPDGLEFVRVERTTGVAAVHATDGRIITEAFLPGQTPNPPARAARPDGHTDGAIMGGVF